MNYLGKVVLVGLVSIAAEVWVVQRVPFAWGMVAAAGSQLLGWYVVGKISPTDYQGED